MKTNNEFEQESNLTIPLVQKPSPSLKNQSLKKLEVFGYSVGHFHNDLCCASWQNYTLYFVQNIVFRDDPSTAGFYAG